MDRKVDEGNNREGRIMDVLVIRKMDEWMLEGGVIWNGCLVGKKMKGR